MAKNAKIKIMKDGPYLVTGGIPLIRMIVENDSYGDPYRWREVERYSQRERYTLCRCGKSKNKPYCDGTHAMPRFNGTETASREHYLVNVKEFLGPELKLTDKPELCVGAGFCDRDAGIWIGSPVCGFLPSLFRLLRTWKVPKPVIWTLCPALSSPAMMPSLGIALKIESTTVLASLSVKPVFDATFTTSSVLFTLSPPSSAYRHFSHSSKNVSTSFWLKNAGFPVGQ